jgi:hypothetical protein
MLSDNPWLDGLQRAELACEQIASRTPENIYSVVNPLIKSEAENLRLQHPAALRHASARRINGMLAYVLHQLKKPV